jgi:hypothetical protein
MILTKMLLPGMELKVATKIMEIIAYQIVHVPLLPIQDVGADGNSKQNMKLKM